MKCFLKKRVTSCRLPWIYLKSSSGKFVVNLIFTSKFIYLLSCFLASRVLPYLFQLLVTSFNDFLLLVFHYFATFSTFLTVTLLILF